MKKITLISIVAATLLNTVTLSAQITSGDNPMEKLSFMVGEWHGEGWSMTQNGRQSSSITEIVECKQNCNIIIVTGLGVKKDSITNETQTVHDAFGVISFDKNKGKIVMRAYRNGEETESELEFISEKAFRWFLQIPGGGKVRFTTDFSETNKWKETGEFTRDGTDWMKIMEMELVKKE